MAEEIKFNDEELKKVKSIQDEYFDVQMNFGNLQITRLKLKKQLDEVSEQEFKLHDKFQEVQTSEKKFLDDITKKYGQGTLNPENGVFTPTK